MTSPASGGWGTKTGNGPTGRSSGSTHRPGALQLHEEKSRTYVALGDRRSRGVTSGDIAWVKTVKSEIDAAPALQNEGLQAYHALRDSRARSRLETLRDGEA